MTVFPTPLNNLQLYLAADYTAGSGAVALAAGSGAALAAKLAALGAPPISAAHPLQFTLIRAAAINAFGQVSDPSKVAIYWASGLAGDALTGVSVREGTTDQAFQVGDVLAATWTAGQAALLQAAVNALEAGSGASAPAYTAENRGPSTLPAGSPVAVHAAGAGIVGASAADSTLPAVGLLQAAVAAGFAGAVQSAGPLTLPDWTAATGAATLAPRAPYYLDAAGRLTTAAPSARGRSLQRLGVAVSPDTLEILVDRPILL